MAVSPIHVGATTRCSSPPRALALKPDSSLARLPRIGLWGRETSPALCFNAINRRHERQRDENRFAIREPLL